jgi:hypothetical protein
MTESPTAHHGQAAIGEEVALDFLGALRAADAVDDDVRQIGDDDRPADGMHDDVYVPKRAWSSQSSSSVMT